MVITSWGLFVGRNDLGRNKLQNDNVFMGQRSVIPNLEAVTIICPKGSPFLFSSVASPGGL
jgi:hypothetical protein